MNVKITEQQKVKLLNSDDVFEVMQKLLRRENKIDRDKEHFWIIGLAVNNKILFIEMVSLGGIKSATVEPMKVFRVSVMKDAVKVILVHNHPSGELKPSNEDKDLTDRLIPVGIILSIEVIEHLVISLKSYLSFGDIGLLEELKESTKWIPNYVLEQKIRKEELKIRKEAVKIAKEKKAIEIAKKMLLKGVEKEDISDFTGLSKSKITVLSKTKKI